MEALFRPEWALPRLEKALFMHQTALLMPERARPRPAMALFIYDRAHIRPKRVLVCLRGSITGPREPFLCKLRQCTPCTIEERWALWTLHGSFEPKVGRRSLGPKVPKGSQRGLGAIRYIGPPYCDRLGFVGNKQIFDV